MEELDDNLELLEEAARTPARQRRIDVAVVKDEIAEHAQNFGLPTDAFQRIITLLTLKTELDQATLNKLVRNLYPAERVASDVVVAIAGALGTGRHRPPVAIQSGLVKWLYAVLDAGVLAEPAIVSSLYGVFFDLLDMISLRAALCQLLVLITRRKHVKPFRVQRLLELCQQMGNEAALLQLVQVYKHYHPEIIVGNIMTKRSTLLSQKDVEWQQRLLAIQALQSGLLSDNTMQQQGFVVAWAKGQRRKPTYLPVVHTYHPKDGFKTLEEITSVEAFVDNLEKIDPPSQLIAGLKDPLLQKYLLLNSSADSRDRLEYWLTQYLEEELNLLREGFGLSATLGEVLAAVATYAESSKSITALVMEFLRIYLPLWDGSSNTGVLIDIVAYSPMQSFQELHSSTLSHLERAVLASAVDAHTTLIDLYTNIANRWLRHVSTNRDADSSHVQNSYENLNALFKYASTIALTALVTNDTTEHAVLTFYETIAIGVKDAYQTAATGQGRAVPMLLAPSQALYLLAHSSTLNSLSRVCSLLTTYKQAFTIGVKVVGSELTNSARQFNCYMMDVLNLFWRSKALSSADPNSLGCLVRSGVYSELHDYVQKVDRDYTLQVFFGPPFHPLLSALSRRAFVEAEEQLLGDGEELAVRQAGPVTQQSLKVLTNSGGLDMSWKDYRVLVLDFLAERGADGLKLLVYSTMKDMMR